ncbi:MAG: FAD-dependent oxidoreductase [Planctomycetes bacterium]|nr:FAD-dependent oxidoreductase [Planctomycetota bacterium]MBI3844898.1 FAD-dependent oxidoreductase [Planctomycetota bacterium]
MPTRREFLERGLGGFLLGLLGGCNARSHSASSACGALGATPADQSGPFLLVPPRPDSVSVGGFPFAADFTGDPFDVPHPPIHQVLSLPTPSESADVVVVGGGLSGLATAYLLRHRNPVVLEFHDRFGGNARGEIWDATRYSLGSAYFIVPDKGSFLEGFYRDLGLDHAYRLSEGGNDPVVLDGVFDDDFWSAAGLSPDEVKAFQRYREIVRYYAEEAYPDIPLPEGADNQWILDLDQLTLKEDIEQRLGYAAPPLLAAGIQSYCYSSFGAGWEEISAAGGWNFLAAEEYGRWVLPGGNAHLVNELWHRLQAQSSSGACALRAGCRVMDVRSNTGGAQVTYTDSSGNLRAIQARRVVMACPKFVAKYVLHDFEGAFPEKFEAMNELSYRAYLVANVLLRTAIERDFYDTFLLGDGDYPTSQVEAEERTAVADMLSGHFARRERLPRSVLTLYWPLAWPSSRFSLVSGDASWRHYAERLVPQIHEMLSVLRVDPSNVVQVRMTRWGHALPISEPGFIARGSADLVRQAIDGTIFFVNQDNWALPAVENSLLDAQFYAPQIEAGL